LNPLKKGWNNTKNEAMVYVFKTSVKTKKEVKHLTPELNGLLPNIKWNFDLEDCEKIFRVETSNEIKDLVVYFLKGKNYFCEELTD